MSNIKFYVIPHIDGEYSVQTNRTGVGLLLNSGHPNTKEGAEIACNAANLAIKLSEDNKDIS
jgi:hypothetical protein